MKAPTREELAQSGTLEELYAKLEKVAMGPGWNKPTPSLWASPRKTFQPGHWRYEQARGALDAAGRLINTELAERRNLILVNPAEGNTYGTVRTIVTAYQMIMPGEWARAHRHTPNALRLILDAEPGTYTVVDGANIAMEPGDVLLTPRWCSFWSPCSSSRTRTTTRATQRSSLSRPPPPRSRPSCSRWLRPGGGSRPRRPRLKRRSAQRSNSAARRSTPSRCT